MLTKYKKSAEKVAMGLMSFMPGGRDLKTLQSMMQHYEENPNWNLYLWKLDDDIVGLIGIEVNNESFTIHHVSVNPSFRNEGIGQTMVEKVQQLHDTLEMHANKETNTFLAKCKETYHAV
ncbi:GNAT family N-acetyltransferase [Planococcus sp. YIM B11945]|uniref:GNAT family N-acetyltransferase n=1 Tax=Planococcus sp. YIM B11945 TaxID=3435410 RepID=UPI003D7E416B